jgi:uncharacterized membrane protein
MKPTQKSLKPHVTRWVRDDLITQDQANSILAEYPADSRSSATMTFSIIGGLLCILGLILLISANWQVIPREAKLGGLLSLLIASTLLGTESSRRKWHPAITEISYLFATALPLVGLTLISQFFNLRGSGLTLVLTWFVSILLLPFLSFSPASFIVWWMSFSALIYFGISDYHLEWFDNEARTGSLIYAAFGVTTAAASQSWTLAGQTIQRAWGESLGLITTSLALYAYGFDIYDPKPHMSLWEVLWSAVFLLNLGAVFAGYKLHRRHLVTLGLAIQGITIVSFYLRLAGSMLSTGMLFLSAGTLLLILIFALHKLRKTILK